MKSWCACIVLLAFICSLPCVLHAQRSREESQSIIETATEQAKVDVKRYVDRGQWMVCGFFVPVIGVAFAYSVNYPPKEEALMGKSPEYIKTYTQAYKKLARTKRFSWAMFGCSISTVTGLMTWGCYQSTKDNECCVDFWNCNW